MTIIFSMPISIQAWRRDLPMPWLRNNWRLPCPLQKLFRCFGTQESPMGNAQRRRRRMVRLRGQNCLERTFCFLPVSRTEIRTTSPRNRNALSGCWWKPRVQVGLSIMNITHLFFKPILRKSTTIWSTILTKLKLKIVEKWASSSIVCRVNS